MGQPRPLFVYFRSFQTQILLKKTVDFSWIRTRIVGVQREQTDHLTTTTAHQQFLFQKTFGKYLLFSVSTFVPTIIMMIYMVFTLCTSKETMTEAYTEYLARILMVSGFASLNFLLSRDCNDGKYNCLLKRSLPHSFDGATL